MKAFQRLSCAHWNPRLGRYLLQCHRTRNSVHFGLKWVIRVQRGSMHSIRSTKLNADKDVLRILEQAENASAVWAIQWTDFYPPPVILSAMSSLQGMADVKAVAWGGYPQAERQSIALAREEILNPDTVSDSGGVVALEVKGNFMFDPATHRDFLGAILGTGIERSRIGDILLNGEKGAQIVVSHTMVDHLESALTQVRSVPVVTRQISLDQLIVPAPKTEHVKTVESSVRLDAIASAGFRMSRSKMADLIKSGNIRVNWKSALKASVELAPSDVVSCSGKGRIEITSVEGTSKGKYIVQMVRYV